LTDGDAPNLTRFGDEGDDACRPAAVGVDTPAEQIYHYLEFGGLVKRKTFKNKCLD
jgi:hypothetical protein